MSVDGIVPSLLSRLGTDPVAHGAQAYPSRRACVELRDDRSFTYAELHDLVARCAALLLSLVREPQGARIASLMRNSVDGLILSYACDRVGAIFVPLNWRLSGTEVAAILADCQPSLLVFDPEFTSSVDGGKTASAVPTFTTGAGPGSFGHTVANCAPSDASPPAPDLPSIMLYTSGTTGRPKGVVLTRYAAAWGSANFISVGGLDATSVLLCDTPMFHTVGLVAVARSAILCGGTCLISDRFLPGAVLQRASDPQLGITHLFGVPQIAQMLVDLPEYRAASLAGLKALFLGGAPLPASLCRRLTEDGVTVCNGYGMTETSTIAHMPLDPAIVAAKPTSVGLAAPASEIRISRQDGVEAEVGAVGEIWVRGPALLHGYWQEPAVASAVDRNGWFHTGDLGYRDTEGYLFIVDRLKEIYISGGENVYPAEVERIISALPGVREVGVVGIPSDRWGEVGCAFVAGPGLSEADILDHCSANLARYKRPALVRLVSELPRTPSGKIRRDELRSWARNSGAVVE